MLDNAPTPRFKLFNAFGVPVHADTSALLLLALVLLLYGRGGPAQLLGSVVIAAVAFVSLIGHELGHAFAVRKLGYGKSRIVLGGLGGVCMWYGTPTRADAIKIALAGPAASLAMGALALLVYLPLQAAIDTIMPLRVALMAALVLNVVWGVFNLLPIFPMDGGRALRSALAFRYHEREAERRTLIVSMVIAGAAALGTLAIGEWFMAILLGFMLMQNWNAYQRAFPSS